MNQPIGTINGSYFTQEDLDFAWGFAAGYSADVARFEALAATAEPRKRGGYAAQAKRARENRERMLKNWDAKLSRVGYWGAVVDRKVCPGEDWIKP